MSIQVIHELCAGCGACEEACPVKAIHLANHWAEIDEELCTQCEACIDACPNGAITVVSAPASIGPIVALPSVAPRVIKIPAQTKQPEVSTPGRGLIPLAGAVLGYLGREVAPQLVDALVMALERRLTRPATTTVSPLPTSSRSSNRRNRCVHKQTRYRGGRIGRWKS